MTEQELVDRIRNRHPAPAWAVFDQVRNQTGFRKKTRTVDALALSLWPSNGLTLHGFECKCSASDVRKELDDPTKADEFAKHCDFWWLVVADVKLVEGISVPEVWGVLGPHGRSLKVIREATKREALPLTREFVCGLARRMEEMIGQRLRGMTPTSQIEEVVAQRVESSIGVLRRNAESNFQQLAQRVKDFEEASGVSIGNRWHSGKIGDAVKYVLAHGADSIRERSENELRRARQYVDELERFVEPKSLTEGED